ncbi:hypothetical protein [Actinacidiphila glaucinigra]|uniref:hypothetical protein n=1 Tax=Actinacidiphila glaucinigra TaxID=235986 RepID=UPI002E366D1C|nr:hypothetical protein [Actinacidiphila glaucinigra]
MPAAVAAAIAPYDRNSDIEPYQGEWDHWHLGGPGKEFTVLPGHEHDPRLIREPLTSRGEVRDWVPSLCDGGPRELLDFAAMRLHAATEAERRWRERDDFAAASLKFDLPAFYRMEAKQAVPTEHLLTLDGVWTDGSVPSRPGYGNEYLSFANAYLDSLAPDILVIRLRIHC